jgi:hypothetical protein
MRLSWVPWWATSRSLPIVPWLLSTELRKGYGIHLGRSGRAAAAALQRASTLVTPSSPRSSRGSPGAPFLNPQATWQREGGRLLSLQLLDRPTSVVVDEATAMLLQEALRTRLVQCVGHGNAYH